MTECLLNTLNFIANCQEISLILQGLMMTCCGHTADDLTVLNVHTSRLQHFVYKFVLEPQVYKHNVYTPLYRCTVAVQQTTCTETVDIGTLYVQILAIR